MIPYILHVSILIAGCYIFYWLLLRKETFFRLNRGVLIASLLIPIVLPLITIPPTWALQIFPNQFSSNETTSIISTNVETIPIPIQDVEIKEIDSSKNQQTVTPETIAPIDKPSNLLNGQLLIYLYGASVVVFIIAFLIQLILILAKMTSLNYVQDGKYKIVELVKEEAPFSFWNTIFINPTAYDSETYEQVLAHEKIHIDQSHYLDMLLVELAIIVFWFNPFVWLFRKAITNNLEFLTDASMLTQGFPKQSYQMSLLKVSVPHYPLNLTTNYNQSFLKNRITMMNAKKSSARSVWKYLFILPLLGFSMLSMNAVENTSANADLIEKSEENPIETITENSTNNEVLPIESETEENKELREEVMTQLKKDNLLDGEAPIFKLFPNKILLNEKPLNSKLRKKYKAIFQKHGISSDKSKLLIVKPLVILSGTFVGNKDADSGTHIDVYDEEDYQTSEKDKVMRQTTTTTSSNSTGNQASVSTYNGKTYIRGNGEHQVNGRVYHIKPGEVNVIDENGNSTIINESDAVEESSIYREKNNQRVTEHTVVTTTSTSDADTATELVITNANGKTYMKNNNGTFLMENDGTETPISMGEFKDQVSIQNNTQKSNKDFPSKYKHYFKESKGDGNFHFLHASDILTASTNQFYTVPTFCEAVNRALVNEGIVNSEEKIILYYLGNDGLFVNGQHFTGNLVQRFENIAKDNKIPIATDFHFELYQNQVIILDQISSINQFKDDLLDLLSRNNFITNKKKKMVMEISGNSMSVNGKQIPTNKYGSYFQLFNKHRVIPSPGKTIVTSKKGGKDNIEVGYRKDNAILGTFASFK